MTMFDDFRTSYIIAHINKNAHKQTETWCVTRILSKLGYSTLKPVFQQVVLLGNGKHSLVDLYFPAIKYGVEVNENYHVFQSEKDAKRNNTIVTTAGITLKVVDCNSKQTIETINKQCDDIADEILSIVKKQNIEQDAWDITPGYYIKRGHIDVDSYDCFSTIDDICATFSTKQKKRGFLAEGGEHKLDNGYVLFWPKSNGEKWKNEFNNDFTKLVEYSPNVKDNARNHANVVAENPIRITFFKYKDVFNKNCYRYVGDFKLDIAESIKTNKLIWNRVATKHFISK